MRAKQKSSIIFWIIFLAIVILIVSFMYPTCGKISKQFRLTQARNYATSLSAASAVNYTQRKFNASHGVAIRNCKDIMKVGKNLLPANYQIAEQSIAHDQVVACKLSGRGINDVTFDVVGVN